MTSLADLLALDRFPGDVDMKCDLIDRLEEGGSVTAEEKAALIQLVETERKELMARYDGKVDRKTLARYDEWVSLIRSA